MAKLMAIRAKQEAIEAQKVNAKPGVLDEIQKKKSDAIVELVTLTALIQGSKEEEQQIVNSKCALELASWKLSSLFATLTKTTVSLEKCARSGLSEEIREAMEFETDLAERKCYYNSEDFCKIVLRDLVRWAAFAYLCKEYEEVTTKARRGILDNLRANPSVSEVPMLAEAMKKKWTKRFTRELEKLTKV